MSGKGLLGGADYSFGPGRSPVAGAALSALTTAAVTAPLFELNAHHVTHLSPSWALVAGAAVGGASAIALAGSKTLRFHEGRAMCYRAACWLSAGMWSWWQLAHRPWSWTGMAALGIGAAVAAVAGWSLERAEDKAIEADMDQAVAELAATPEAAEDQLAQRWEPLIEKVTRIRVRIVAVKRWADDTGYTLEGELPLDGTTLDDLKPHEQALATAAGLKAGCNVLITEAGADTARNVVWLRVNTVNAMAQDQPLPEDWAPRTIENPVPVGVVADGTVGSVSLRERCLVVVGESGGGKSTALNVITKGTVQCVDTVVMMIDTKGGGEAARRWVRAWYEGRARRPALTLVANTDYLAMLMVAGLVNIVDGRPSYYAELMHEQGADKIMPSPSLPQIILVVDEFKSLPDRVKDGIEVIADKGRSAGVRLVLSSLDPTSAGIPSAIIKQCRERYGVRVRDEASLHHLFDGGGAWTVRFDPRAMTHPGMGLLSSNGQTPYQIKGWRMEVGDIDATSIRLVDNAPDLDQPSIDMFDTVTIPGKYGEDDLVITNLWKRFWPMTLEEMFPNKPGKPKSPAPAPVAAAPAAPAPDMDSAMASVGTALADLEAARQRLQEACNEAEEGDSEDDEPSDARPASSPDPEFEAIVGQPVPEPRDRYRQLLRELGPTGATEISSRMRLQGYRTSRQTVHGWLTDDVTAGLAVNDDGKYTWTGPE
jgi:hypothetical protein